MPQNFIECDREQVLLMPPSLRDWLPEDHVAWFMLATAEELDLSEFYAAYRADGHGRPAHDPQMMVALLLYAYAKGERSSREERQHHPRIMRGGAVAVGAVGGVEGFEVELLDRLDHEPGEMVLVEPVA
jgi:hypothetical protein